MHIIPIDGIGVLVTGPEQPSPVEVWQEGIVALTRLPGGRCLLPILRGPVSVRRGGQVLAQVDVVPDLAARHDGGFAVAGHGAIEAWMFLPETDVGILAGERPSATGQGRIDLARRAMPHRVMTLAVQVRDGDRRGPVRFFAYRPEARAATVRIDHASSHNGPVTHIQVDPAGLDRVQVEVARRIRQTGQERFGRYEINSRDDLITFEDLLHGDEVDITASPPFALAGTDGRAVQVRRFRYRAVPEPRLEPVGDDPPIASTAGLRLMSAEEAIALLQPLTPPVPTWREEWPVATAGEHASLVEALQARLPGVDLGPVARDPAQMAWWLGLVEARQDPHDAALLAHHRITCAPAEVGRVAEAARELAGFPAHIFAELDGQGPTDAIVAFQERLGMARQDGAETVRLAAQARQALAACVQSWRDGLARHAVDWIDGALPPLEAATPVDDVAQRVLAQPEQAISELWQRRNRIWQVVQADAQRPIDLRVRRALLAWHLDRTARQLDGLGLLLESAGATMPRGPVEDIEGLARRLAACLRAAEPALARLEAVPVTGSAFVEDAAAAAAAPVAKAHDVLGVWSHAGVPAAVRLHAERLLQRWGPMLVRLHVWSTFLGSARDIAHELEALESTGWKEAASAGALRSRLEDAARRGDTEAFAAAQADLRAVEGALAHARLVWQQMTGAVSAGTQHALELGGIEAWGDVSARVASDVETLRELVGRIGELDRRRAAWLFLITDAGGELERAARALAQAPAGPAAAQALLAYDRVRQRIPERLGGSEAIEALEATYIETVRSELQRRIKRRTGRLENAAIAALEAYADIEGAREMRHVARAVATPNHLDVESAQALVEMMERAEAGDTWGRVQERVRTRLRPIMAELGRYMGDNAPRWSSLEDPDRAIAWLHAMANGRRDDATGSDPAALQPGNRRLLDHALKEKGLWLP